MIKKVIFIIFVLFLIDGCSKPNTVVITSHTNNNIVSEVTAITCEPFEESEISTVKLYIDGIDQNIFDNTLPFTLKWNTINYEDNSEHIVNILAFDPDGDSTFSDTLILNVDNSNSYPKKLSISNIVLKNKGFNIGWEKSEDNDFSKYILEKGSKKSLSDAQIIFESNIITDTQYRDKKVNPLKFQYYRINVVDYLGYKTIGDIFSSNLEKVPSSVNIKSIEYNESSMEISWNKSVESDFLYYSLYKSNSLKGKKDRIAKISSKNNTFYSINDFNPLIENWFWVEVVDIHGYKTLGSGKTNLIDPMPSPTEINEIIYDDESLKISWNQSIENDFKSYEVLVSNKYYTDISLDVIDIKEITSLILTEFDPTIKNNYKIITTDIWEQKSIGKSISNKLDKVPKQVAINSLQFNKTSLEFEWSKSDEDNFDKYYICHTNDLAISPDTIAVFNNQNITSYKLNSGFNPNIDNWIWVIVSDTRNQSSISPPQVLKNNPPQKPDVELKTIQDNELVVKWSKNTDDDFKKYILIHSHDANMRNKKIIFESKNQLKTNYNYTVIDHSKINYFQLIIEDEFGVETKSDYVSGVPTDLQVLLDIVIENNLNIIPSELGTQVWSNGRLKELSIGDWSDGGGVQIHTLPESIGGLSSLKNLWLSYNKLSVIPESFSNLSSLEILELRSNNYKNIPETLIDLRNLKYLGLSYNNISEFPDWVSEFKSLNKLYLSHNNFNEIHESICEMNLNYKEMGNSFLSQNGLCTMFLLPDCIKPHIGDQSCSFE